VAVCEERIDQEIFDPLTGSGDCVKRAFTIFGLAVLILALGGCMEEPNPVGAGLLPGDDFLKIDSVSTFATASTSIRSIPPHLASGRLLIGKFNDLEAWSVLLFSGIPDSLEGKTITGVSVLLRAQYHFGDSLAPYSMAVHQLLKSWEPDSLTINSLGEAGFYQATPMASPGFGSVHDTATISIPLDTAVVRSWIQTVGDSITTNFGMLLRPTNSGVVKGFGSFTELEEAHKPTLQIRFTRTGSTTIDTVNISAGVFRSVGTMADKGWSNDGDRLHVQNGVSYRGVVTFDAVKLLPPHAALHQAILELTLDAEASQRNSYTRDSVYAYFVDKEGKTTGSLFALSDVEDRNGVRIYKLLITRFVEEWVRGAYPQTVVIVGAEESYAFDHFALHGSAAPAALKPILKLSYSPVQ
jgi:hypothetical protein